MFCVDPALAASASLGGLNDDWPVTAALRPAGDWTPLRITAITAWVRAGGGGGEDSSGAIRRLEVT
jgi:hypothetical protein